MYATASHRSRVESHARRQSTLNLTGAPASTKRHARASVRAAQRAELGDLLAEALADREAGLA